MDMKILIDEMYEGFDDRLKELGYTEVESVKKLVNDNKPMKSDFSVLKYAKDNDMILVTGDKENEKGCIENNIKYVCPNKDKVFDLILSGLKKYESNDAQA